MVYYWFWEVARSFSRAEDVVNLPVASLPWMLCRVSKVLQCQRPDIMVRIELFMREEWHAGNVTVTYSFCVCIYSSPMSAKINSKLPRVAWNEICDRTLAIPKHQCLSFPFCLFMRCILARKKKMLSEVIRAKASYGGLHEFRVG